LGRQGELSETYKSIQGIKQIVRGVSATNFKNMSHVTSPMAIHIVMMETKSVGMFCKSIRWSST
jgi:hypothetical protein